VNLWNSLPQRAVEAKSMSVFKTVIDRFLINKGIGSSGKRQENRDEKISAMIEWWSRLDGPNGLILLICFMVLFPLHLFYCCQEHLLHSASRISLCKLFVSLPQLAPPPIFELSANLATVYSLTSSK